MEGVIKFLKEQMPALDAFRLEIVEHQILVITVKTALVTKKNVAKLGCSANGGEEFLFHDGAVALAGVELARVEGNGTVILADDAAKLAVGRVGVDVEREGEVRTLEEHLASDDIANLGEGRLLLGAPDKLGL